MATNRFLFFISFYILLQSFNQLTYGQCTTPISTFPYQENFESSNGNWTVSTALHWEWGAIVAKPVITTAGNGTKCWIAGGFSGSNYSSGKSYLQSPCFNISSLINPEISFLVFWETERKYDGAGLQYSIDGGASWQNLGSINSNTNCSGENWFNYDPINFVGGPGWSGNIQTNSGSCLGTGGSGTWLRAKHTLSTISGSTGVIFRFSFGAGLTCNSYDGFAIDDIRIGEGTANLATFNYVCQPNNTVAFQSSITGCKQSINWNFGDVASGSNNTSTDDNPSHSYGAPGIYTVTMNVSYSNGQTLSSNQTIQIIDASISVSNPISCNGKQNGALLATVTANGTYSYSWNSNPIQTNPLAINLPAGNYQVTISGNNSCAITVPFQLTEPDELKLNMLSINADCGIANGSITSTVTGGTNPYQYQWSTGSIQPSIQNLAAASYSLLITDKNGCTITDSILVLEACGEIYFPTAFTPDGNGMNDAFGPSGNLSFLTDYSLTIFDRWGNRCFSSNNPYYKWNAEMISNKLHTQNFVWIARFRFRNSSEEIRKGTILLIR